MKNTLRKGIALAALIALVACQGHASVVPGAPQGAKAPQHVLSTACSPSSQPVGTITEYPLPWAGSAPAGLAVDGNGHIWEANQSGSSLGEFVPGSNTWTLHTTPSANSGPLNVTRGADGNIWFTEFFHGATSTGIIGVVRLNNNDTIQEYSFRGAFGIDTNPDGYMYATGWTSDLIAKVGTNGPIAAYPRTYYYALETSSDSAGNVWYTGGTRANVVVKTLKGGEYNEKFYYPKTASAAPYGITEGPAGSGMWFTELNGNKIGNITSTGTVVEYTIPTANSQPVGIISACGNLWFAEQNGNKIGEITPAGQITEYPVPTANSSPNRVTVDANGTVWFSESNGNKIASIATATGATPPPPVGCAGYGNTVSGTLAPPASSPAPISTTAPAGLLTTIPVSAVGHNLVCGAGGKFVYATGSLNAGVTMQFDTSTQTPSQWSAVGAGNVAYRSDTGTIWENGTWSGSGTKSDQVAQFSSDGLTQTYYPDSVSFGQLVQGSDSNLYTLINTGGAYGIQQIHADGTQTSFGSPCTSLSYVNDTLAVGPPGQIWSHEQDCGVIVATTGGTYTVYPALAADGLNDMTYGPDGAMYAADATANAIVRINPADGSTTQWNVGVQPQYLTAGPNGTVWFEAYNLATNAYTLDELHLASGQLVEYDLAGQTLSAPFAVGADSNIYTFGNNPNAILKIDPSLGL